MRAAGHGDRSPFVYVQNYFTTIKQWALHVQQTMGIHSIRLFRYVYKQLMAELKTVFFGLPWQHDQRLLTKPIIYELYQLR